MDNAELGKRIKTARLAKKMTQSDVAGTFITRNMLSLIENGNASPSMKTLEYLSNVLEIPMDKLLSDSWEDLDSDSSDLPNVKTLTQAKQLLSEKKYQQLVNTIPAQGMFKDELHALRSIALLEIARELSHSGQADLIQQAVNYARSAAEEANSSIYANPHRVLQANQIIAEAAQFLSDYYSRLANANSNLF